MYSFPTLPEAREMIGKITDRQTEIQNLSVADGVIFSAAPLDLGGGRFTNVFDLSFRCPEVIPDIVALRGLRTVNDHLRDNPSVRAATTGGFFYLVDRASGQPRHLALNLIMSGSRIHSMPVRDQETVVASDKGISTHQLQSIGVMSINGKELDWSGAATEHDTAVKIYGNGNSVIRHIPDSQTVTARALDESSRFTPQIRTDDQVDIGFVGRPDGKFTGVTSRRDGGVDIFEHDFVARCTAGIDTTSPIAEVHTIDSLVLSPGIKGAFSAGPMLDTPNFVQHPINSDLSLGSNPPMQDRPLARTVLFKDEDGLTHIRLFDGRPDSLNFTGITITELVESIMSQGKPEWGCFLDPGQTAKIGISGANKIESFGNQHYLEWPNTSNSNFVWRPNLGGRPVASLITI